MQEILFGLFLYIMQRTMPTQQDYKKTAINSPYDVALALFSPKWLKKNIWGIGGVIAYETTWIKTKKCVVGGVCIHLHIVDYRHILRWLRTSWNYGNLYLRRRGNPLTKRKFGRKVNAFMSLDGAADQNFQKGVIWLNKN